MLLSSLSSLRNLLRSSRMNKNFMEAQDDFAVVAARQVRVPGPLLSYHSVVSLRASPVKLHLGLPSRTTNQNREGKQS